MIDERGQSSRLLAFDGILESTGFTMLKDPASPQFVVRSGHDASLLLPRVNPTSHVPLYHQVKTILADAIRRGDLAPGSQLPSTTRLARLMRVSLLTTHRALRSLAEEGWVDRGQGRRTLIRKNLGSALSPFPRFRICLAVPRESEPAGSSNWSWLAALHAAAANLARPNEYLLHVYRSAGELEHLRVDGLLCIQPRGEDVGGLQAAARSKPLVALGSVPPSTGLHSIDSGHEEGARSAIRHLLELGHQQIAMVVGPDQDLVQHRRLHGFLIGMGGGGLPVHDNLIVTPSGGGAPWCSDGRLARLMHKPNPPTAIIVGNVCLGLAVAVQLRQLGLDVPRDVSLIAFEDHFGEALDGLSVTAIAQPVEEMSRQALARVMVLLEGRTQAGTVQLLPMRLIDRGSTARPPRRLNAIASPRMVAATA